MHVGVPPVSSHPASDALALLPILIGLGNWQWHRKAWKEDLIAKIETRRTAEPVSYPAALSEYVKTGDVEYLHVRVTGTFDHGQERHLYAPDAPVPGMARLYVDETGGRIAAGSSSIVAGCPTR